MHSKSGEGENIEWAQEKAAVSQGKTAKELLTGHIEAFWGLDGSVCSVDVHKPWGRIRWT